MTKLQRLPAECQDAILDRHATGALGMSSRARASERRHVESLTDPREGWARLTRDLLVETLEGQPQVEPRSLAL